MTLLETNLMIKRMTCLFVMMVAATTPARAEVKVSTTHGVFRGQGNGIVINTGQMTYKLGLTGDEGMPTADKAVMLKGIRLYPSKRGWSGLTSFLQASFDDVALFPGKFTLHEFSGGKQGKVVLVSDTSRGKATLTFAADDKGDCLMVNVNLEADKDVGKVTLKLHSYPGEISKWAEKKKRCGVMKTLALTPKRTIEKYGKQIKLDPATEPWLLMYDENYDPALNKTKGGEMCAAGVLYNHKQVEKATLRLGNGLGNLTLTLPGTAAGQTWSTDMVLWEFFDSNAKAIETMKSLEVE